MSVLSIVVPTLTGREDHLALVRDAYEKTVTGIDVEWIEARDKGVAGEAWNAGASEASGDYLMLACDDMVPHPGWLQVALDACDQGVYPAPRLILADGTLQNCGSYGGGMWLGETADGTEVRISELPFMKRGHWTPDRCLPIHYYSDDWLGFLARMSGLRVEVRRGYCFTHLKGQVGRAAVDGSKMREDRASYLMAVSRYLEPDGGEDA